MQSTTMHEFMYRRYWVGRRSEALHYASRVQYVRVGKESRYLRANFFYPSHILRGRWHDTNLGCWGIRRFIALICGRHRRMALTKQSNLLAESVV